MAIRKEKKWRKQGKRDNERQGRLARITKLRQIKDSDEKIETDKDSLRR